MTQQDPTTTETPPASAPAADLASRPRRRRKGALFGCSFFLALLVFLGYIGVLGGNVRVVEPGRFYRSSQLTGNGYEAVSARLAGHSLDSVLGTLKIKTLINLRGGTMQDLRYRDEVAVCDAHQVTHVDIPFSARHLPSPETMEKMLDTFDHAAYPILVHCQAGSDRTGLASTVYANLYMHEPLDLAETSELTWRYGHFSASNTRAMDEFFDLYRQTGKGESLRDWIYKDYPTVYRQHEPQTPAP